MCAYDCCIFRVHFIHLHILQCTCTLSLHIHFSIFFMSVNFVIFILQKYARVWPKIFKEKSARKRYLYTYLCNCFFINTESTLILLLMCSPCKRQERCTLQKTYLHIIVKQSNVVLSFIYFNCSFIMRYQCLLYSCSMFMHQL